MKIKVKINKNEYFIKIYLIKRNKKDIILYFTFQEVLSMLVHIQYLNYCFLYFLSDLYNVANVLQNMDFLKFLLRTVNLPHSLKKLHKR